MSNKEELISINGLSIKENAIYKITEKLDNSAPTGFIKEGATKLPSLGIGNTVPCRFAITNKAKGTGVYDTGLYVESPCYAHKDKTEVKRIVASLKKSIVEPYESKYGKGTLDQSNEDFWNDFGVDLFSGRFFVTSNVDDLLDLYIAMLGYELTPKEQLGNPKFSESQYCIEDKEEVQSVQSERANNTMDCIMKFGELYSSNYTLLQDILRYIRFIPISHKIDKKTLKASFFEWLKASEQNIIRFNKTYSMSLNDETADEISLYTKCSKLFVKGIIRKSSTGHYMYKDTPLGADFKTVAKNLNKKENINLKVEILEIEI